MRRVLYVFSHFFKEKLGLIKRGMSIICKYMKSLSFLILLTSAALQLVVWTSLGQDEKKSAPTADSQKNKPIERDWLESYYENPVPGEFIPMMKEWAKDGTLQNQDAQPALIAFTSQLMRQNRNRVQQWWLDLKDLDAKDRVVFNTALVFARVGEADAIVKEAMGDKYDEFDRPPKILEIPLEMRSALDMIWGYFYATGSEKAVRRLLMSFRFAEAPEKPEGVEVPEGYQPYYLELPELAFGSLLANMERHPKLVEICDKIYREDKSLHSLEKNSLHTLLSLMKPEKYSPKLTEEKKQK